MLFQGNRPKRKSERWSRIAGEAICQSRRARTPEIDIFEDLDSFLTSFEVEDWAAQDSLKLFALERKAGNGIRDLRQRSGTGYSPDFGRSWPRRRVGQRGNCSADWRRVQAGEPWAKDIAPGDGCCGSCLLHPALVGRYGGRCTAGVDGCRMGFGLDEARGYLQ